MRKVHLGNIQAVFAQIPAGRVFGSHSTYRKKMRRISKKAFRQMNKALCLEASEELLEIKHEQILQEKQEQKEMAELYEDLNYPEMLSLYEEDDDIFEDFEVYETHHNEYEYSEFGMSA